MPGQGRTWTAPLDGRAGWGGVVWGGEVVLSWSWGNIGWRGARLKPRLGQERR